MKTSILIVCVKLITLLAFSIAPFCPSNLSAEELKVEVSDAAALKAALEKLTGKSVTLRLNNGDDISGLLEAVGPTAVRVGQLSGKEFYTAIILIEHISAVVYRSK